MELTLLFLTLSVAFAAVLVFLTSLAVWQALLLGLLCYILLYVLVLAILYIASMQVDRSKPIEKQQAMCRAGVGYVIDALCVHSGVRAHFTGLEKLPETERFYLVCNHRSMFDPCLVMAKLRRWNISFISKPANLQIPVIGRIAYAAGFLSIDRENNREALKTILAAADYLKRDVCSMGVYPEGTRSKDGNMLPFHAGCFKVAQRAGVPVVVAAVYGTEKVVKNIPFKRTDAYMDILEVIPAERVKAMSTNDLSDYCRALMQAKLDEVGV